MADRKTKAERRKQNLEDIQINLQAEEQDDPPEKEPEPEVIDTPVVEINEIVVTQVPTVETQSVYLTRGIKDPESGFAYFPGKYFQGQLPQIAFDKGYVVTKP